MYKDLSSEDKIWYDIRYTLSVSVLSCENELQNQRRAKMFSGVAVDIVTKRLETAKRALTAFDAMNYKNMKKVIKDSLK